MTKEESNTSIGTADLLTEDGVFVIQERRSRPRLESVRNDGTVRSHNASDQMMALGGLIILGVLVGSYTTKYDIAFGHAQGPIPVPAVGFLALQLFLARSAYRLFHDVREVKSVSSYVNQRLLRYLPAVVPAVLLAFLLLKTGALPNLHVSGSSLPANLTMMADMLGMEPVDGSHWRLKIEIILSLMVGMAWFGVGRKYLASTLLIGLLVDGLYLDGEPVRQHTLTLHGLVTADGYLPLIAFGIALLHLNEDRGAKSWWLVASVSTSLAYLSNTPWHGAFTVAALVVLASITTGHLKFLGKARLLVLLGELAFPIYVVHFVSGFALIHFMEALGISPLIAIASAAATAIVSGYGINVLFERPLQRHGLRLMETSQRSFSKGFARATRHAREIMAGGAAVGGARIS